MLPGDVTHVLYHAHCQDGFGAAWAAWKRLGSAVNYLPVQHGSPPPELSSSARVAMLDFTYKRPVLETLRQKVTDLIVLDHHQSAKEDLAGVPGAFFDLNHSGAYLSWRFFHPDEEAPLFIRYIEDRDLWRFSLPKSRDVSMALSSYPLDFGIWNELSLDITRLFQEGASIARHVDQQIAIALERVRWIDLDGHRVPVINTTAYYSEVANALCHRYPEAPFAAVYFDLSNGKRRWSLRSTNGFNVIPIAQKRGGGGHPAAAGFEEPISSA